MTDKGSDTTESNTPAVSGQAVLDRRLQEAAQKSLNMTGYHVLADVDVQVVDGRVQLSGHVPSYHLKAVATAAVLQLDAVTSLRNNLSIQPR